MATGIKRYLRDNNNIIILPYTVAKAVLSDDGVTTISDKLISVDNELSTITQDANQTKSKVSEMNTNYNVYASIKDGDFYTVVEFKRSDGSLYCKSTLSNKDTNARFQTCTVIYYASDGITPIDPSYTWTFGYDSDGKITSKVVS